MMFSKSIVKATLALVCLYGLISVQSANAAITLGSVTPSSRAVTSGHDVTVNFIWNLRTNGGVSKTIDVDDGLYVIDGTPVDNTDSMPSQTKTSVVPANFFTFTFTETLTIPASLIENARHQGKPLIYRRSFSDDGFTTNTDISATFYISGGIDGTLDITRLELSFADGSSICSAKAGQDIFVKALFDTDGTGILRGNWQASDDTGSGFFHTIKTVMIPSSAGRKLEVMSPPISWQGTGRMAIRFEVTSPEIRFITPVVSCILSGQDKFLKAPNAPHGVPAKVILPQAFQPIDANTNIQWEAIKGAKAYRVDILAEKDGEPVASLEINADKTSTKASALVMDKLSPTRRYTIKVTALTP